MASVLSPTSTLPVVDADAHVIETETTWDYLEPGEEKYRPRLFSSDHDPTKQYWVIDGKIAGFRFPTLTEKELAEMSAKGGREVTTTAAARELDDVDLRLAHLDELGIDVQVLHNTLWIEQVTDRPEVEVALSRSWNRWMADVSAQGDGRLPWSCVLPMLDLEAAKEEMRYAQAHGAAAVCLRPFEGNHVITDERFYPLFDEAQSIGMPMVIHISNGSPGLCDAFRSTPHHTWATYRVPTVVAAFSLITGPVTTLFPNLTWGIIEASAQWCSWVAHEVAIRWGQTFTPSSNPFVDKRIYVTTQEDDDIDYIVRKLGDDFLVIGTDYGHTDSSSSLMALASIRTREALSESTKTKILSTNAMALYGLADQSVGPDSVPR